MSWIGEYPEDFTTIAVYFTTHDLNGAPVAPSTSFEAADVKIYKNGSATEKTTTNGLTMTSPFDSITGLHRLLIDTSNDTGDASFWVAGAVYTVVLSPDDETVNGQSVVKVLGTFGIRLVTLTAAQVNAEVDTAIADAALATAANLATVDTVVDAIKLKTDNLPSDPADQSIIIAATDAILAAVNGLNDLSSADVTAAVLTLADGVENGITMKQALRAILAVSAGQAAGLHQTGNATFKDAAGGGTTRVTTAIDVDAGTRAAPTLNL